MNLRIDLKNSGLKNEIVEKYLEKLEEIQDNLWLGKHELSKFVKAPLEVNKDEMEEMLMTSIAAQDTCSLFIIVGHGGSIEGIKAVIDAVGDKGSTAPQIEYLGYNFSTQDYIRVLEKMRYYEVNVCVISRTGETSETLVGYKIVREAMIRRYGNEVANKRIMVMTGPQDSSLRSMALEDGCGVFDIPLEYPGSFSIMSPASLFPMAVGGVDIKDFMAGAEAMATDPRWDTNLFNYALLRAIKLKEGKKREILQVGEGSLEGLSRWISHLFAETQSGIEDKLYCHAISLSRDLSSIIHYTKDLQLESFETEIFIESVSYSMDLPKELRGFFSATNLGELNRQNTMAIKEVYQREESDFIKISLKDDSAFSLGQLVYFLLMSATITGYLLEGDPFSRCEIKNYKKIKNHFLKNS